MCNVHFAWLCFDVYVSPPSFLFSCPSGYHQIRRPLVGLVVDSHLFSDCVEHGHVAPVSGDRPADSAIARATFVSDVTIPDHTVVVAGSVLDKRWRVCNTGGAPWPADTVVGPI